MFSGIVRAVGKILEQSDTATDRTLTIALPPQLVGPLSVGGSIAVNGVCLTVTSYADDHFTADVSTATLGVTTLGRLGPGANVNLEPPMRVGDPIDGHIVTGHVDGVGEVVALTPQGRSTLVTIELPAGLERYVARKGSIAVDGVSLTVNAVRERRFDVNIIPHTSTATIIAEYRSGSAVNIEVDIIARYLERLEQPQGATKSGITLEFLQRHGYASND
jgi:riboflavin synthase